MEYLKKCQKCEFLRTVFCYGTRKGTRSRVCHIKFLHTRREYVKNLPQEGRVTSGVGEATYQGRQVMPFR